MIDMKRILTAAATLVVAAGAGFVMQNTGAIAARLGNDQANALPRDGGLAQRGALAGLPSMPRDAFAPARLRSPGLDGALRIAAVTESIIPELGSDIPAPRFPAETCRTTVTAVSQPGAMVRLALNAPCHGNERIAISHAGLFFADVTDGDGNFSVSVPALQKDAVFEIAFADGSTVEARALVLTQDGYERVGISWSGPAVVNLHAMEFGAGLDDPGHVWSGAPRDPSAGVQATGGFLTTLGNAALARPQLAQVYSFPQDRMNRDGSVQIVVDARIDESSCGQDITARTVRVDGRGQPETMPVAFPMPACDGENGFLVLKNLFQDMKIARN